MDESLRRLVEEDEAARVPSRVESAVMRAWDARVAAGASSRVAAPRPYAWAAVAAAAAAIVVVAVLARGRPAPVPEIAPAVESAGHVLVVDPPGGRTTLNVVRVRMPRRALPTLGVPIVNPEADGFVDVEMLVGEDGVARSIRRAVFVGPDGRAGAGR